LGEIKNSRGRINIFHQINYRERDLGHQIPHPERRSMERRGTYPILLI